MSRNDEQGYNGWANYATWRVNLEIFDGYDPDGQPVTAEWAEEYADELLTMDGASGLVLDYANAFLANVDWHEIANAINENHDLTPSED